MTRLSSAQIAKEHENCDVSSITSLQLSHRALTDISCLIDFANLERLDLSCNNLSTLEGLSSCINLKWLSVVQNKLQSLKGVEGLSKLMVLNAGHNKLTSMDEVGSLTSLRALILNDNNISSICRVHQLNFLNTLVLSRNPVHEIGNSLMKSKSITKLSLSHCHIQSIGSSLMYCVGLREVRLADNEIMFLPAELAHNAKIQTLDLGNNLISNWSDLMVLTHLHDLKNLNLKGNQIAEKDKLAKKVKKLLPNLKIFNSQPTESSNKNEKAGYKENSFSHSRNGHSPVGVIDHEMEMDVKRKMSKKIEKIKSEGIDNKDDRSPYDPVVLKVGNEVKRKGLENTGLNKFERLHDMEKEVKRKRSKNKEKTKSEGMCEKDDHSPANVTDLKVENEVKRKRAKNLEETKSEGIDDGETPFTDLIVSENAETKRIIEAVEDTKLQSGLVAIFGQKKKRAKNPKLDYLFQTSEVGTGGPSAWDV